MLAGIRYKTLMMSALLVLVALAGSGAGGQADRPRTGGQPDTGVAGPVAPQREEPRTGAERWLSRDLHVTAGVLLSHKVAPGQHLLLGQEGFSMTVGGRQFTSRRGLVWIAPSKPQTDGRPTRGYQIQVYLAGRVFSRKVGDGQNGFPNAIDRVWGPNVDLTEIVLERDKAVVVRTSINGEIFVTAQKNDTGNPRTLPLYQEAISAFEKAGLDLPPAPEPLARSGSAKTGVGEPNRPAVGYTISYAPLTDVPPKLERTVLEGGQELITIIGRIYLWWEQPTEKKAEPLELREVEADSVVLWRQATGAAPAGTDLSAPRWQGGSEIYVAGNVVFRQGQRTIYADDLYYDLQRKRGSARNVVLKSFDTTRDVPIYVRAKELRQTAENEFEGDDVVLTTSEFWKPQISLQAAQIRLNDRTQEAGPDGVVRDSAYDVELKKVRFKYGNVTLLGLPTIRANRERPDLPIRSVSTGYDSTYGASLETRWFLDRILGLHQPAGTDSTLYLDYYGKRGPGGGVGINYEREDFFGRVLGYMLEDHGEDRLSRTRRDVDVPDDLRGRFLLQHRQYLPYGWQLTAEASYLSDENFLEQFYRTEYNVGKEQETLLYLKRIQDNWGLAFLGKVRTNDFLDQVEELPSAEYHLTGQSLFGDRFTFFSDNQVSRYRYRFGPDNPVRTPDDFFWFTGTRNELDLPLTVGRSKVVPFVAGTFGYDDGAGFHAPLDDQSGGPEEAIWIGEGGVRMAAQPYWAIYPEVESRLWDLHQLRHVVTPTVTAVHYVASEAVAAQRDTLDLEIAQRWQTKRGPAGNLRTVDWLELNTNFVWVTESDTESAGPDQIVWNTPFIPLVDRGARVIPPVDRRATDQFGPRQNYAGMDGILRLTDATSILGDAYFGMQTSTLEQADIGFSRLCWPDLTYYVGTRYLRRFTFGQETRSSNALTFAVTYILDPRYTLVFSEQYDFHAGANIATDLTLIRKYHRMNLALTFSVDESLDEKRVVLSLWPEGIPELTLGLRRYMGLGASDVYH
jgi:hypothetical protein